MATMKDIAAGLAVFLIYEPDGTTCAEHDELLACGVPGSRMADEHLATLESTGWFWSESNDCWMAFT